MSIESPDGERFFAAEVPSADHWFEQIKCQAACPVHTDARGYVQAIARGDYEAAYLIARAPNPLASVCGRICGAPCESACRRGELDSPIQIRALKRFVSERFGAEAGEDRVGAMVDWLSQRLGGDAERRNPGTGPALSSGRNGPEGARDPWGLSASTRPLLDPNTRGSFPRAGGEPIAIVGSGPAGLAAGHDLALMGFAPVIFEMEPVPAGMLAVGVPEYRLPRDLIRAEIEIIRRLGVEIRCETSVGVDVTLPELREEFAAVVLATGAKRSRHLSIPGAGAEGVLGGVEFLRDIALGRPVDLGQRVVVIGGGNVAYDVGRSVIRNTQLDAATLAADLPEVAETYICCLEGRDEMPADQVEIIEGGEEGIQLHAGLGPREILLENGHVAAVEFVRCTRVFDERRRFAPEFDDSERTTIPCDTVLLAIGQEVDLGFVDPDRDGIRLAPNGAPLHDPATLETDAANVFVAGDLAYGTKLLIHAVASGKQVARSLYRRFVGQEIAPEAVEIQAELSDYAREYDFEARRRIDLAAVPAVERIRSHATQVELPLLESQARYEASRCLDCSVNTIFDSERCILCGGCVDVCPTSCLKIVDIARLEPTEELEALRRHLADGGEATAILKDESVCIRCGLCAARCPAAAITMEHYCREELIA